MSYTESNRGAARSRQSGGNRSINTRLYAIADLMMFVGLLNLLIVGGVLAGLIFLGFAPTLAAATATVRARLRGEGGSVVRRFASHWWTGFGRAHLLQLPAGAASVLIAANLLALTGANTALTVLLWCALAIAVVYQLTVVAMDAHYELSIRACLFLAGRFLICAPASALVLACALCVVGFATWVVPGLLPVLTLGGTVYICTALCLSFFAANDERIAA